MDKLQKHRLAYKQALKDNKVATIIYEKACITSIVSAALLNQEPKQMQQARAVIAELSALADHFDSTGKPGDRWRALTEVLTQALESGKPLQQLRLVLPTSVSGKIIEHIQENPGIRQDNLAKNLKKSPSHISNEIKKLENAGLIYRLKRGGHNELFLSVLGKETMDSLVAETNTPNTIHQPLKFDYLDPLRTSTENKKALSDQLFKMAVNG